MGNLDKVPSVISYSPSSGAQERQWGASLSPEAVAMVHTKLQLEVHKTSEELDLIIQALDGMGDLDFQHVQNAEGLPSYTWKGPERIVEDYLTKVFDAFLPAIEEMAGLTEEVRAQMLTDIVVTIPAVCHRIALFVTTTKSLDLVLVLQGQKLYVWSPYSSWILQRHFPKVGRDAGSFRA